MPPVCVDVFRLIYLLPINTTTKLSVRCVCHTEMEQECTYYSRNFFIMNHHRITRTSLTCIHDVHCKKTARACVCIYIYIYIRAYNTSDNSSCYRLFVVKHISNNNRTVIISVPNFRNHNTHQGRNSYRTPIHLVKRSTEFTWSPM
jgi:hypothetical protein